MFQNFVQSSIQRHKDGSYMHEKRDRLSAWFHRRGVEPAGGRLEKNVEKPAKGKSPVIASNFTLVIQDAVC